MLVIYFSVKISYMPLMSKQIVSEQQLVCTNGFYLSDTYYFVHISFLLILYIPKTK